MNAKELFDQLSEDGVVFKRTGNRLRLVAKQGYLTPEKVAVVKQLKEQILELVPETENKILFRFPPTPGKLREHGLEPLEEDMQFLARTLPCDDEQCSDAVEQYIRVWLLAMEREPVAHKKQNIGRRAANSYLRQTYSKDR